MVQQKNDKIKFDAYCQLQWADGQALKNAKEALPGVWCDDCLVTI
jgi:hypothetical protein